MMNITNITCSWPGSNNTTTAEYITGCTLLGIESFNVVLHAFGAFILLSLYMKHKKKDSQEIYLINFACTILIWNIVAVIRDSVRISWFTNGRFKNSNLTKKIYCINIFLSTGMDYMKVLAMVFYTADRLAHILLHAR